ncbi:hypothetical protein, partial [uncultured Cardiobacterium sp.]|uniref:hypothetical protein n=1 Tax=uncultured Cardiobacterium sp. TaxID=417619 RepID=UPI00261FD510
KADEEKRHEFLEVKSVYEARLHPFVYMMEAASKKTSPVLTSMHHAGKNAQGYPDGARHKQRYRCPVWHGAICFHCF